MTRKELFILPIKSPKDIHPGDYEIDIGIARDPELAQYESEMSAWCVFRRPVDNTRYRVRREEFAKVA